MEEAENHHDRQAEQKHRQFQISLEAETNQANPLASQHRPAEPASDHRPPSATRCWPSQPSTARAAGRGRGTFGKTAAASPAGAAGGAPERLALVVANGTAAGQQLQGGITGGNAQAQARAMGGGIGLQGLHHHAAGRQHQG